MMEYWNDDLKEMTSLYLISVNRNFTITQLSIFSLSLRLSEPEAQNPILQSSIIPTFPPGRSPTGRRPMVSEAN
jgi:hypothetical protein